MDQYRNGKYQSDTGPTQVRSGKRPKILEKMTGLVPVLKQTER